MNKDTIHRANITYWLGNLVASGVQVPETRIVTTSVELWDMLDGDKPIAGIDAFFDEIRAAAGELGGFPCFLRTGHGSGKHDWKDTCHVPSSKAVPQHVFNLVEWSASVDMIGLPTATWAVRKLLPLFSSFNAFNGFPVNVERRYFIEAGHIVCAHPYWPPDALETGRADHPQWRELLEIMNNDEPADTAYLVEQSFRVADAFAGDGAWSLDWAMTKDHRWYAIDMAPAAASYHWSGCPNAALLKGKR